MNGLSKLERFMSQVRAAKMRGIYRGLDKDVHKTADRRRPADTDKQNRRDVYEVTTYL